MPGSLIGLTYSEFDNKVGSQLKFAYPPDVMSKELFEAFSDYVIVSSQLCEKSIVVTMDDMLFLNYSMAIDNPKYDRNALLFSFGCILAEGADIEPYETVLKKVSSAFVSLEIESEYLFQAESKQRVQEFLKTLFEDLTNHNESCIRLDTANYFAVKLFKSPSQHYIIHDYDVPVFKASCQQFNNPGQLISTNQPHQQYQQVDLSILPWDISFQHLLPFIDGKSSVKRIINQVDMDGEFVRRSLSLLLFHDCIMLTDIFKFTNVYQFVNAESSLQLLGNAQVLNELRDFCALDSRLCVATAANNDTAYPSYNQLINFAMKMQNNKTVQQIILESLEPAVPASTSSVIGSRSAPSLVSLGTDTRGKTSTVTEADNSSGAAEGAHASPRVLPFQNMDIARCVAYLQYLGIIKRLHEYPSYVEPPNHVSGADVSASATAAGNGDSKQTVPHRRRLSFSDSSSQPQRRLPIPDLHVLSQEGGDAPSSDVTSDGFKYRSQSMVNLDILQGAGPTLQRRVSDAGHTSSSIKSAYSAGTESIGLGLSPVDASSIPSSAKITAQHPAAPAAPAASAADASIEAAAAAAAGTLPHTGSSGNFQRLVTRNKVVVGRNYLTDSGSSGTAAKVSVESIAMSLNGKMHLDQICTEFNVSYNDIVKFPGILLVYK